MPCYSATQEPGEGLVVGGVTLPLALADLGLIDEYEFLVQPVPAGHGPTLHAGLRERIQLELANRQSSGRGRSPCDTCPRELRLHVICPGAFGAASRRNCSNGLRNRVCAPRTSLSPWKAGARWRMPVTYPGSADDGNTDPATCLTSR
jgi:hypothetical protein